MSAHASDPAVEYWASAMASVREQERRRSGLVPVTLQLAATVGTGIAGHLAGQVAKVRTRRRD